MESHLALFVVVLALVGGCATTPVRTNVAEPVPSNRVLETRFFTKNDGSGELVIKRDAGFSGSACETRIFVDGMPIADIMPSEKVVLHLKDGEHMIGAEPKSICGGHLAESRVTIKHGNVATYRVGYGTNGYYFLEPTAF